MAYTQDLSVIIIRQIIIWKIRKIINIYRKNRERTAEKSSKEERDKKVDSKEKEERNTRKKKQRKTYSKMQ